MTMNRIDLPAIDVPASRAFFEEHFGFERIVEVGADRFVGLIDDCGMALTMSNFKGMDHVDYPEPFHADSMQSDDVEVDEVFERPRIAGMELGDRKDMHGARTFFQPPGGFAVAAWHRRDQDVFPGLSR